MRKIILAAMAAALLGGAVMVGISGVSHRKVSILYEGNGNVTCFGVMLCAEDIFVPNKCMDKYAPRLTKPCAHVSRSKIDWAEPFDRTDAKACGGECDRLREVIKSSYWLSEPSRFEEVKFGTHAPPDRWRLPRIFPMNVKMPLLANADGSVQFEVNLFVSDVSPHLLLTDFPGNRVSIASEFQGHQNQNHAQEGERGPSSADQVGPIRQLRCLFSSNSTAPLGAQISILLIWTLVAAVQVIVGSFGFYFRCRPLLWGLLGCNGILMLVFFLWWSSPCNL